MVRARWWPIIRTVLFAHLFTVAVIGLFQFALTSVREPGFCAASPSPWDSLSWWFQAGRKRPLMDCFDAFGIQRFNVTIVAAVFLGMGLGWSIWSMRPLRLTARFRLRTLMAVIALVPLESGAGTEVWNRWERWDLDQRFARSPFRCSSAAEEIHLEPGDTLSVNVHDALLDPPIEGDRIVLPDGRLDLGYYGRLYVTGLTVPETKEKIISRLRKHLEDRRARPIAFSKLDSLTTVRTISSNGAK